MICKICKKEYARTYCDYCSRRKRWTPSKYMGQFTPRIKKALKNINIKINIEEIIQIRKGNSLYLTGEVGCGKSLLAACMMLESIKLTTIEQEGPMVNTHLFVTVPDLLNKIRQSFDEETPFDWITIYSEADFLVLDDLGAQKDTDWVVDNLYRLINYRYEYMKSTIFTSNLSLEELEHGLGERISSRINEMGPVFTMKGKDYRI